MMLLVVPCQVLGRVDALRKRITSVGKEHASVCAKVRIICIMIYILIAIPSDRFTCCLAWR
jgi:hypothetical protein